MRKEQLRRVDVELSAGEEAVWRLTQKARSRDVKVILSKHDSLKPFKGGDA